MTDYFALLEQPRQPWLDLELLKQAFHEKTLRAHPDAQSERDPGGAEAAFAEVNEAYQVLRDPKRRLHHLLTLEGSAPATREGSVPEQIEKLFLAVAALTRDADGLIQKLANATSALSRSLLKPELVQTQERLKQVHETMYGLRGNALRRLQRVDANDLPELHALYLHFSYLSRWIAELEEKQLQLLGVR